MNTEDEERLGLPSASDGAFWNCAGKQNLMEASGYPESPTNPDAERGTAIHNAFQSGNTLLLDEEQEETYQQGLKFLSMLFKQWEEDFALVRTEEGPREERFWIHDADLNPIVSAKLDRHYTGMDKEGRLYLFIPDLKSGFVPNLAPSPRSTQLRVQANCANANRKSNFAGIRVAYVKAKLKYGANDYCDYGPEDIAHSEQWMQQHLWLSKQPDALRTPGPHCTFCPAKPFCREAGAYSLLPSVIADNALQASGYDAEQAVAQLSEFDLVRIWEKSTLIRGILEAVTDRLKGMPDTDLESLGITRSKAKELHNVTHVAGCVEFMRSQNWDNDEIYACMEFSLGKIAEKLRDRKNLPSDKAAKELAKKMFAEFITVTETKASLKKI